MNEVEASQSAPVDWWWESASDDEIAAACRQLPMGFRLRWARNILETLGDEYLRTTRRELPGNGSFIAAKARRTAIHAMREVCGLTIPQIAPLVGMTVFSVSKAAHQHRERHRYLMAYAREASEVGMCDSWRGCFAVAMYETYEVDGCS